MVTIFFRALHSAAAILKGGIYCRAAIWRGFSLGVVLCWLRMRLAVLEYSTLPRVFTVKAVVCSVQHGQISARDI